MSDTTTPAERMEKALARAQAFVKLHGHDNTACITSGELFLFRDALKCAQTEIEHWDKLYLMMTKDEQRLTKIVDWLADKLTTESQNCRDLWRGPEGVERTPLYVTRKEAADAFVEAARRAVAAGEEPCQK